MIEDHICGGDFVLVERVKTPRDGEIVVALVNGEETTLKRIFREGDKSRLQPANAAMEPIVTPAACRCRAACWRCCGSIARRRDPKQERRTAGAPTRERRPFCRESVVRGAGYLA